MASNLKEEVKNENVSVIATKQQGGKISLQITVTPKATDAAYAKAIKQINKNVSIPGFRKGKAPDEMIIKHYAAQIDKEWKGLVLTVGLQEALELLPSYYPYKKDQVNCSEIKEMSREKGAQFTLDYEIAPQVPVINLSDITLQHVERRPVDKEAMQRVINNLQLRLAQWEDVTDRGVEENDYVDLDIDKIDDPQEIVCREARFEVADMAPWMKKLVVGLNINETAEGVSQRDAAAAQAEQEDESVSFKPTRCLITVRGIKKPVLPELNDELCQRLGVPNPTILEERIIADLNRAADQEVIEKLRQQLDDELLTKYHFDMPASLVQAEYDKRLGDAEAWFKQNRQSEEAAVREKEQLEKTLPQQVEKSCRLFFLIMSFANQHKIGVTQEEVAQELSNQILQGKRLPTDKNSNEIRDRLTQQIVLRKCRDYIIEHVKRM